MLVGLEMLLHRRDLRSDRHGDYRDEHGLLTLAELYGTFRYLLFLLSHRQLPNRV